MGRLARGAHGVLLALLSGCTPTPGSTDASDTSTSDVTTGGGAHDVSSDAASESAGDRAQCVDDHVGDLVIDASSELDEYRTLRSVSGQLVVRDLVGVTDLAFLSCLEEVGDWLTVAENPNLVSLHGLGAVHSIGMATGYRGLNIASNPSLLAVDGLDSLTYVPDVGIHGNDSLVSLGLSALESVDAITLGGCSQPEQLGPAMGTGSNDALVSLDGLESLQDANFVTIGGQQNLASIDSLIALSNAGVDLGGVTIQYNPQLPIEDIEQLMASQGHAVHEDYVCGNLGGAQECDCFLGGD